MKPANAKAHRLLEALTRLANPEHGGTPAECAAAMKKLERLRARFDFTAKPEMIQEDIFAGVKWEQSYGMAFIATLPTAEGLSSSVKWAIEGATGLTCVFRGEALFANAGTQAALKLSEIAGHLSESFKALLQRFGVAQGVTPGDRGLFVMGLLDGLIGERRELGQRLPARIVPRGTKTPKARKGSVEPAPGVSVHPYTLALDLGKQIRFSASVDSVVAEFEKTVNLQLKNA